MKKRIGSGVLALCLLLALLPGNAWAAEGDTPTGGTDTFVEANGSTQLQKLIADKTANIKLTANADFSTTSLEIPADYTGVLDLNGKHITSFVSPVVVKGNWTVMDSTAKENDLIVNNVNDKNTVPYQFGSITTGNVTTKRDAIHVQNNGTFVLQSGTVSATNIAIAVEAGSMATINSGYVKAREFAVLVRGQGAKANINGGILLSEDNAVVAGNGLPQNAGTTINMSGGTLVSNIETTGYTTCGIYHPQKGTLNVTGGKIIAHGGVGILMRGGELKLGEPSTRAGIVIDTSGDKKPGKVGDAGLVVPGGQAIVIDSKSSYYDWRDMKATINSGFKPDFYCPDGYEQKEVKKPDGSIVYTTGAVAADTYTVTFDAQGGSTVASQDVAKNGKVTKPTDPTRTGHTFGGWYKEAACTTAWNFDTDTVTGNITLYAKWTPVKKNYTITLNPNGGTLSGDTTVITNDDGKLATLPADPTRTDYTFLGWYTSNTGGDKVTTDTVFTKNSTVYAMWKSDSATDPVTYTITFYQNENDTTAYATKTTNADGAIEWPAAPTKEGFVFKGWANEDGDTYSNNSVFFADTKLYAQWKQEDPDNPDTPKTFTITLDANGGTLSGAATVTTNAGGKLDNLPAAPTREGYSFDGWFTAASGGKEVDLQSPFEKDSTIYAHWTKNGGTPSDEDEYRIYAPSSVTGGRLYVSHRTAAPGTRVTIELRPWSDYELDWLSVVNLDTDRELRLTERYTDEYTFTMPSSDVEVDVSYTDRYYNNYYGGTYYVREVVPAEPKPVKWYYSNGSIFHVTDGMVPYGGQLTRDMLLSVLYNMDPARSGDPTIWAADKGIIPDIYISVLWGVDKPITREQTAMILYCFAQHMGYNTAPATSLTGYADYRQISDAARPAVAWAKAAGLIAGTSPNTLSPGAVLTCGQANAILARFTANVARTW